MPIAWALQAKGFYYAAEATRRGNTIAKGRKFVSTEEIHLSRFCYKTACYLLSHSIELSLKAIYCVKIGENLESFSHRVLDLLGTLINKKVLEESEFDIDTIKLANILLHWYGRYHKPNKKNLEATIKELYTQSPDSPDYLERKFKIDDASYGKLQITAKILLQVLEIPSSSIAPLIFDPF